MLENTPDSEFLARVIGNLYAFDGDLLWLRRDNATWDGLFLKAVPISWARAILSILQESLATLGKFREEVP